MPVTPRDTDCAFLARQALFPLKVNRDGTHQLIYPAAEALQKIRDTRMQAQPNRSTSSFFPRRVVVVKDGDQLTWNGQPDINHSTIEVIPGELSVKCQECGKMAQKYKAFTSPDMNGAKQIVLCTDRLLKNDYTHGKIQDLPRQSLATVEEALAHEITRVAVGDDKKDATKAEILAARAAECYYGTEGGQVRKGSQLGPVGYSLFPSVLQRMLREKCIRAAVTRRVGKKDEVDKDFDSVMSEFR